MKTQCEKLLDDMLDTAFDLQHLYTNAGFERPVMQAVEIKAKLDTLREVFLKTYDPKHESEGFGDE